MTMGAGVAPCPAADANSSNASKLTQNIGHGSSPQTSLLANVPPLPQIGIMGGLGSIGGIGGAHGFGMGSAGGIENLLMAQQQCLLPSAYEVELALAMRRLQQEEMTRIAMLTRYLGQSPANPVSTAGKLPPSRKRPRISADEQKATFPLPPSRSTDPGSLQVFRRSWDRMMRKCDKMPGKERFVSELFGRALASRKPQIPALQRKALGLDSPRELEVVTVPYYVGSKERKQI